jgi:hypothetical protein
MLRLNQVDDDIGNKENKTRGTAACPPHIRTLKQTLNGEISIIPRSFDVGTPDR